MHPAFDHTVDIVHENVELDTTVQSQRQSWAESLAAQACSRFFPLWSHLPGIGQAVDRSGHGLLESASIFTTKQWYMWVGLGDYFQAWRSRSINVTTFKLHWTPTTDQVLVLVTFLFS